MSHHHTAFPPHAVQMVNRETGERVGFALVCGMPERNAVKLLHAERDERRLFLLVHELERLTPAGVESGLVFSGLVPVSDDEFPKVRNLRRDKSFDSVPDLFQFLVGEFLFFLFFFLLILVFELVFVLFIQHFRRFWRLGFSHFGHRGCNAFFCLCHQIISFPDIR